MVKLLRKASQSPCSGHHPLGKRRRRNVVRPGDVGQQCSLNQAVPHPPCYWDCAPQHHLTATQLGCGMLQALTLLSLPMPPLSSLLLAGPTAYSCSNIPIPSLLPFFFPTGCLEPSGNHVQRSSLAVPPGFLCPLLSLLRQQPLGWMQGCISLLFRGCCCWGSSPDTEGKPRAMPCISCVHPSGDAEGNYSITGSFRNAVFY